MSILDTFQKNFDSLKSDFTEYKDYHDTMITVIPSILELLDSLFLEDNIKTLPNFRLLKEDYLDVIKRTLDPDSYRDVKFEADLPDIYDAPRTRREKARKITKLKAQKVTTLPARIILNRTPSNPETLEKHDTSSTMDKNTGTIYKTTVPMISNLKKVEIDKALQSYAQEGKRLYNYKSPLDCENKKIETSPDKILIELPDEMKACLYNDGKIMDISENRQLGFIDQKGVIMLNNTEFGKIKLVDRDEEKYASLTNNFGKMIIY